MGPRLVRLRRKYKLNQSELGEMCGVTKAAVSQWETGVSIPEIKKLLRLRSKLAFSFDWLITGEGEIIDSSLIASENVNERRHANRRDRRQADRRDRSQWGRREDDRLNNIL